MNRHDLSDKSTRDAKSSAEPPSWFCLKLCMSFAFGAREGPKPQTLHFCGTKSYPRFIPPAYGLCAFAHQPNQAPTEKHRTTSTSDIGAITSRTKSRRSSSVLLT